MAEQATLIKNITSGTTTDYVDLMKTSGKFYYGVVAYVNKTAKSVVSNTKYTEINYVDLVDPTTNLTVTPDEPSVLPPAPWFFPYEDTNVTLAGRGDEPLTSVSAIVPEDMTTAIIVLVVIFIGAVVAVAAYYLNIRKKKKGVTGSNVRPTIAANP